MRVVRTRDPLSRVGEKVAGPGRPDEGSSLEKLMSSALTPALSRTRERGLRGAPR
jgi:hypothetical protein